MSLSKTPDNYIKFDEIIEIEAVGEGEFYDLRVPIWNNYLAEGLIHHNCGKTLNLAINMAVYATLFEGFRGFALAPEAKQANEVLKLVAQVIVGTRFEKCFRIHYTKNPNAIMVIGHETVGENTIECYPLLKREDSLLTLTGDCAIVDQAEKFDDLEGIQNDVGTRFRGRVVETGRGRLGTLTFIANSDYNDQLWKLHKMAEEDPDHYLSMTLSTYDNPYLTEADLDRYEVAVGSDEESIRIHLKGGQPLGDGKEFSGDVLKRMVDTDLDALMDLHLSLKTPGYSKLEAKHIGVHEWLLPALQNHSYLVISDPGTDNPPNRNAYAILVWDITNFPGKKGDPKPATLAGFIWGSGHHDIKFWANKHAELTFRYQAITRNGFDATGFQAGYDQWMPILNNLLSEKINLSGNAKALCLNSAKMLTSAGMIKLPQAVTGLYNQLQRYELPEPSKLRQDLVMAFIMSCQWLQRLYYMALPNQRITGEIGLYQEDRYARELDDRDSLFERN